jgi:hypothetical protein
MNKQQLQTFIQDHGAFYAVLLDAGIHYKKNCTIVLSIDNDGVVRKVKVEEVVYKM